MKKLYNQEMTSILGRLAIIADDNFIIRLLFENDNEQRTCAQLSHAFGEYCFCGENDRTQDCARQLHDYLKGTLREFTVKVRFYGSDFDRMVWNGLQHIPYGHSVSYQGLAEACGVRGSRAVGGAVGRNPLPILVPCHRVIRSDGSLGGFGGGPENKIKLLDLEHILYKT